MRQKFNYKKSFLSKPDYLGRRFFLADKERKNLYRTDKDAVVEVFIDQDANLTVFKISRNGYREKEISMSLRAIGEKILGLKDPSVHTMLNYLVLPEMEVERIFNNIRYKYLKLIEASGFKNPSEMLKPKWNNAFQALTGVKVYQGNAIRRKENDYFWKEAGFSAAAKSSVKFDDERKALRFIIMYFRHACPKEVDRIYSELIAIKPGFHEIWVHDKYFDKSDYPEGQDVRSKVFRALRGYDDVHLRRYPAEINSKAYLTYASCNVTEGPFVFRKNLSVSYFSEIKKIRSKGQENRLTEKFHILGYHHGVRSRRLLKQLLKKADKFRLFM